jgi:hypothetical protein
MNTARRTLWTDGMILASIRDFQALTYFARERALELASEGLIDVSGTWRLTDAGHAKADPAPYIGDEV